MRRIRVLDFGHTIMGPCTGLLLADLGADVIKIEPVEGDATRRLPGFAARFFATFGRNRRGIAVQAGFTPGEVAALIARSIVVDRTAPAPAAAVAVA